jgi:Leu/Phe-tRNA-protein transferase
MPAINIFYGIIMYIYFSYNQKHHLPYVHTIYQDEEGIYGISVGKVFYGNLPLQKYK